MILKLYSCCKFFINRYENNIIGIEIVFLHPHYLDLNQFLIRKFIFILYDIMIPEKERRAVSRWSRRSGLKVPCKNVAAAVLTCSSCLYCRKNSGFQMTGRN